MPKPTPMPKPRAAAIRAMMDMGGWKGKGKMGKGMIGRGIRMQTLFPFPCLSFLCQFEDWAFGVQYGNQSEVRETERH